MGISVGYQGNHGTFSEMAVLQYFEGTPYQPCNYTNFRSILNDCDQGILDYGMLPVENTTTGIIARTYDLFQEHHVHAVGEIVIPIFDHLIVNPGTKLEEIREVYSHPEAISQCAGFLASHPQMVPIAYQDTAASVAYVKESQDPTKAALGCVRAADYYQMEMLLQNVQDSNTNMTRFFVVTAKEETVQDADKISLMLVLKHEPGSLYEALGALAKRSINVMKLESRPIPQRPFQYLFYIDFTGNLKDPLVQEALAALQDRCSEFRILGNYKSAVTVM